MSWWRRWIVVGALVVGCLPGVASAESEVDILLNKLVEKGILNNVEAGQIRREITETKEVRNKQLAKEIVPDSARNWKWSGDFRLREEYRNRTGTGQDVNRQRIRFRYGFDAKVTDTLKVGARLVTGSTSDPVSANQTLNTAFNHKNILLDRAFAEWSPEIPGVTEFKFTGGVMENPFWLVGSLQFDEDLNFDGVAAHVAQDICPMLSVFTNNGAFALISDISEAASLWSTQGGFVFKPMPDSEDEVLKNLKLTGALAYHDYKNVTNPLSESTAITTAGGQKGNSTGLRDLNILNPAFEIASQYRDVPFSFFSDFVHNTAASEGKNGFMFGVKAGKARVPFDLLKGWEAGYYFERIEPDAVFGAFTESDFGNGGTNHRGHVYWVRLAMLKNSVIQFKYFNTQEVKLPKNHADTFQADWVTKF